MAQISRLLIADEQRTTRSIHKSLLRVCDARRPQLNPVTYSTIPLALLALLAYYELGEVFLTLCRCNTIGNCQTAEFGTAASSYLFLIRLECPNNVNES